MKRGDVVTVAAPNDYGMPRPAVIVQSDSLRFTGSVLVALLTSNIVDAPLYRLSLRPSPQNNLKVLSQVMVDKIMAVPREKCGSLIGTLDQESLLALNGMLTLVIGLAG